MTPVFSMSIQGGAEVLCEDLGWSVENLTRRNLAADTVTMRKHHTGVRSLTRGDTVVLFADGRRVFTGTVQAVPVTRGEQAPVMTCQLAGPWYHFDQTPFTRNEPRPKGSGATATATINAGTGKVTAINVTNGGSGYITVDVSLSGGGATKRASLRPVVSDAGVLTAIQVLDGGAGYTSAPTVTIVGLTQIPPVVGETFSSAAAGSNVQVWNETTQAWETPGAPTTLQWARTSDSGSSPIKLDLARYTGTRGLLCDPNWRSGQIYRTMQDEVRDVLFYALKSRAQLAAGDRPDLTPFFTVDLDAIETSLGTVTSPRYRTWSDEKVSNALRMLLVCKPDASLWWDYSQEVPQLLMGVASAAVETTLRVDSSPLKALAVTPRPELQPAGIVIRWEYTDDLGFLYRGYRRPAHLDKYPATILAHEPGVVTYTLDFADDIATFKPSLAESLMESMGILRATGTLTLADLTLDEILAIHPGTCYRIPEDEALADCQLLVQETSWNIRAGTVECTLGYPRALDLATVADSKGWITWTCQGFLASRTTLIAPPAPA